jgi:hypothetical protein
MKQSFTPIHENGVVYWRDAGAVCIFIAGGRDAGDCPTTRREGAFIQAEYMPYTNGQQIFLEQKFGCWPVEYSVHKGHQCRHQEKEAGQICIAEQTMRVVTDWRTGLG